MNIIIEKDKPAQEEKKVSVRIEKNYPEPEVCRRTGKRGRPNKYPFFAMEIGDSIFAPGQSYDNGARGAARDHGRRYGKKFSCRKVEGGIRIWRIA